MKRFLQSFQKWLRDTRETFRFAMNLDMRAMEDPAWLLGTKPRPETKRMVSESKKRAGVTD
jgi:hypothetical protein